jgi:hypothetical protein
MLLGARLAFRQFFTTSRDFRDDHLHPELCIHFKIGDQGFVETSNGSGEESELRSDKRDIRAGGAMFAAFPNGSQVFREFDSTDSNAYCSGGASQFCHPGEKYEQKE